MKMYIGGVFQGQQELAERENPGAEVISGLEDRIRAWMEAGEDPLEKVRALLMLHPDAVFVCTEVGSGVVPMGRENRAWRELCGRAQCLVAARCERVVRVQCGIGVTIKCLRS